MTAQDVACRISAKASDAIASPFALPIYFAIRVAMWKLLTSNEITLILSDAAMVLLFLLAAEGNRQGKETERNVRAIAEADPKVDV